MGFSSVEDVRAIEREAPWSQRDLPITLYDMLDKTFHTFRKSKTNYIGNHWKWTPFNLVNKHYTRSSD